MISTHFRIENPWIDSRFENIFHKAWLPFKNKGIEIEITQCTETLAEISFDLTFKRDHAGLTFVIGLFTYSFRFNLYDTRHWNYETESWEVYDEEYYKKATERINQQDLDRLVEEFNEKRKSKENK